jgi:D-alanyl-D-alanine carboxypeptidase (penicillin-binding protein 5/6)
VGRRIVAVTLVALAICLLILASVLAFSPMGAHLLHGQVAPSVSTVPLTFFSLPEPPSILCEQLSSGNSGSTSTPTSALAAKAKPPAISATAAYLLDADTGQTLADVNGETSLPMASTTKIMTALIAIETADLNQLVTIHQDAYNEVHQNNGSSALLVVGDKIPLKYLLYGLLLPSGDDAAVAIADAVGGTKENFVHIMNIFALRLHLYQTHYSNPDGLSAPAHYTSAYDLARLARCAMTIPLFAQIVQTKTYTLPADGEHHRYTWETTDTLLNTYKGATGIKTGTTPEAGFCLVFSATHNGYHLIGVVLHSTSEANRFADATALLDWGFSLPATS